MFLIAGTSKSPVFLHPCLQSLPVCTPQTCSETVSHTSQRPQRLAGENPKILHVENIILALCLCFAPSPALTTNREENKNKNLARISQVREMLTELHAQFPGQRSHLACARTLELCSGPRPTASVQLSVLFKPPRA